MGHYLKGEGYEVDGVQFRIYAPGATEEAETPQLYMSEYAELTHTTQVELFGWCSCEDGPKVWDDCTQDGK